jgi:uncharacterized membrane protein YphA (DoxX/SURF4 family)
MAAEQLSLLAVVLFGATLLTRRGANRKPWCEPRRLWGVRLATLLLTSHFFVDGLCELAFAQPGFAVDDAEGVIIVDARLDELANVSEATTGGLDEPQSAAATSWWWMAIATAGLEVASALGRAPPLLRGLHACAQCSAALLAAFSQLSSVPARAVRGSGGALLGFALLGAFHVALSVLVMALLGAGIHLSELMAKRVALVAAIALWTAHVWDDQTRLAGQAVSGLPLPASVSPVRHRTATEVGEVAEPACGLRGVLLLLGRLGIAVLLLCVCGTELARLLLTPLTYLGAEGVDPLQSDFNVARYEHHIAHEHSEVAVRGPQLLLALPLALGVSTSRVACALAMLSLIEAVVVWQWWQAEVRADPLRLSRCVEHFTVNLAISGGLLLLPLRGSGRFTLDRLVMKKRD